jgi:integrase
MKISERTIKRLGEIITGDKALSPYRSGPKLVSFFNDFGTNHAYGQQAQLGHSHMATTLDVYTHASGSAQRERCELARRAIVPKCSQVGELRKCRGKRKSVSSVS